ncbi:hypothetical protein [Streptomyces sp. NBC_01180]|uniref:hypothetical protein n=1 Tax=Streptomyces sp. NBC_01180 TaxID=2903763 RepID=UPI0038695478|nr:hypothetical protein OG708_17655 [Streptomyces sp. NBC_01180]
MPWVRLDDRFPSHRKVALLSDRAFRLHITALCWSSENLTEGKILDAELRVIAHIRNTKAAAKELEERGLWDRVEGGWELHDFLEYNPDKAKVQADRDSNAARQKAFRDRKKAEREAKKAGGESANNPDRNGVTAPVSNSTPVPAPVPLSPTEREKASYAGERDPAIPRNLLPLRDALTAAGVIVGWDLDTTGWFRLEAIVKRTAVAALVAHAVTAVHRARTRPQSVRYFLAGWQALPPVAEGAPTSPSADILPFTAARPSTTDQRVAAGLDLAARLRAQEGTA